mmetsp:Transcript_31077/g.92547  ORF Transcript_31077/g.92547 Transcript_31077/m.92547 type:complete len:212 (-) Transcript_31077:407-1042(-)
MAATAMDLSLDDDDRPSAAQARRVASGGGAGSSGQQHAGGHRRTAAFAGTGAGQSAAARRSRLQAFGSAPVVDLTDDSPRWVSPPSVGGAGSSRGGDDDVVCVMVKPGVGRMPGMTPAKRARTAAAGTPLHSSGKHGLVAPAMQQQKPPSPDHGRAKCAICLEAMEAMASTPCGHVFCHSCLVDCIKAQRKCPKCRKAVQLKQIHRIYLDT